VSISGLYIIGYYKSNQACGSSFFETNNKKIGKKMSTALRSHTTQRSSIPKSSNILLESKNGTKSRQTTTLKKRNTESSRIHAAKSADQPKSKTFKSVALSQRTLADVRSGLASPNTRARFVRISFLVDAVEEAKENRRLSTALLVPDPNNMKKQLSLSLSSSIKTQIDVLTEKKPSALNASGDSVQLGSRFVVRRLQKEEIQQKTPPKTTVVYTF
jgi:hypothetical protein